jgi:hypothetical protein
MLSLLSPDVFETYIKHAQRLDLNQIPQPFGLEGAERTAFQQAWSEWKQALAEVHWRDDPAKAEQRIKSATLDLAPHLTFEHAIWVPRTGLECRWYSPMGMALAGLKVNTLYYTQEEALPVLTGLSLSCSPLDCVVGWNDKQPVQIGLPALLLWALYRIDKPGWGPSEEDWKKTYSRAERWRESSPCLPGALGSHGPLEQWKTWFAAHPQALDALLVLPEVSVDLRTRRQMTMIQELVDWGCLGTPEAWEHFRSTVFQRSKKSLEASEFLVEEALELYARVRADLLGRGLPLATIRRAKPRF